VTKLFDLSPADVADTSDDWYTPPWLFAAAGLTFDMDVAAPVDPERRTCPALTYLTPLEDGLTAPWAGLVWMNPPWSGAAPWAERFVAHGNGLALFPAYNAHWIQRLLASVDALAILDVEYARPQGVTGHMRWPSLLLAAGDEAVRAVERVAPRSAFRKA
jgi:DNA N-6-adenine-methyltransferase (Dam)